ncbi:hypothetical protein GPALN_010623 [Globodera pallida]|nr:hypothetical protein GPALN_010623 [Globodera pallida]
MVYMLSWLDCSNFMGNEKTDVSPSSADVSPSSEKTDVSPIDISPIGHFAQKRKNGRFAHNEKTDVSPSSEKTGHFAHWTFRPLDISPRSEKTDVSPIGHFVHWTFRPLDISTIGHFAQLDISPIGHFAHI